MELGQYQMQIFISLVVILGAAFIALICDLLKGNNEQLRELAIELKVRREEEHKRFQILSPRVLAEATAGAPASALSQAAAEPPVSKPRVAAAAESKAAPAGNVEQKPRRPRDPQRRALDPDAMAAIQRGMDLAASPKARRTQAPAAPAVIPEVMPENQIAVASITPEVIHAPAAEAAPAANGRSRDWGQLLSVRRTGGVPQKESRVAAASLASDTSLPAGFQDGFVLSRLVENRQPVSGLVVSIGASGPQSKDASGNIRTLIQSLLGPNDFAAQSGTDEFLLIYPGERGAQAQRKLSQIAEQLWDFQLRSMGSLSILFSWGGVEVRSESIDEAIASATERMQETRRNRKVLTMEPRTESETPLRRAV